MVYKKYHNLKLIIFDLDGTIIDAYPAIIRSLNYCLRYLGLPVQGADIIRRAVGWGDANLLRPFVRPGQLPKALSLYRRHHKKSLIRHSRLFPGAKQLLVYLKKQGYKLAVASNRPTLFSWILIRHLGLKKYFDYVLCADKLRYRKPHPLILHRIMQRFGVLAQESIYVGDMVIDAQTGRRAKVRTIMVTTGSSTLAEIKRERPYRIIHQVARLRKFL